MARLRPVKVVTTLTFEEKTRVTNFFALLVEIDLRLPKSTKTKKRATQKVKHRPITPYSAKTTKGKKEPCYIKCPAMCCSARRDFFFDPILCVLVGLKPIRPSLLYSN